MLHGMVDMVEAEEIAAAAAMAEAAMVEVGRTAGGLEARHGEAVVVQALGLDESPVLVEVAVPEGRSVVPVDNTKQPAMRHSRVLARVRAVQRARMACTETWMVTMSGQEGGVQVLSRLPSITVETAFGMRDGQCRPKTPANAEVAVAEAAVMSAASSVIGLIFMK